MPDKKPKAKQQQPPGRIFLRGLRLSCLIGIDPAEQYTRQAVMMDAEITPLANVANVAGNVGNAKDAANGANVADAAFVPAVDYAVLVRKLRELAEGGRHRYVEELATAAADMIIQEFAAAEAKITCAKPRPFAGLEEFAAEATRTKAK